MQQQIVDIKNYTTCGISRTDITTRRCNYACIKVMKDDGVEPDILVVLLANSGIVKTEWITESINNLIDNPNLSASCPVLLEMDNHPYRSKD